MRVEKIKLLVVRKYVVFVFGILLRARIANIIANMHGSFTNQNISIYI